MVPESSPTTGDRSQARPNGPTASAETRSLRINGTVIEDDSDCFVIAEIGHNHQGNLETAKRLIRAAKDCGAHAAKLQKRDNRALYTRAYFDRPYENENSFGATYGLHREALEFDRDQYLELQGYANEIGILFFATAFDIPSADFLAGLDVPAFKIASGDIRSIPLLEYVAAFGKPMFISTGTATMQDVTRAYEAVTRINRNVCILQCTANYPAAFTELDLRVIQTYREAFPRTVIGLSSHDNGIAMAPVAYAYGARVIEKHFTLNRTMKGTDHAFSLEPVGMRKLVRDLVRTRQAIGDGVKKVHASEAPALVKMGKTLVAARDLPAGHVITAGDLAMKSPGGGIPPSDMELVLGKALSRPLSVDEPLTLDGLRPSSGSPLTHEAVRP